MKSTNRFAKNIIRNEMLSYYDAKDYGVKNRISAIDKDISNVKHPRYAPTNYHAMRKLVDGGNFAVYTSDMTNVLSKIYGKDVALKLERQGKTLSAYSHLIAREYDHMKRKNQKGLIKSRVKK